MRKFKKESLSLIKNLKQQVMETKKYGLYSQLVGKSRNKKIKESNNYEKLYDKGISLFNRDKERLRDYFIIEYGVKVVKINNQVIL